MVNRLYFRHDKKWRHRFITGRIATWPEALLDGKLINQEGRAFPRSGISKACMPIGTVCLYVFPHLLIDNCASGGATNRSGKQTLTKRSSMAYRLPVWRTKRVPCPTFGFKLLPANHGTAIYKTDQLHFQIGIRRSSCNELGGYRKKLWANPDIQKRIQDYKNLRPYYYAWIIIPLLKQDEPGIMSGWHIS